MKKFFSGDIGLMVISFFISVALWFYIGVQNPETERLIRNIPINIVMGQSEVGMNRLSVIEGDGQYANVTVSGKRSVLVNFDMSDLNVYVDATDIDTPGIYSLPVVASASLSDVVVRGRNPGYIDVRFDTILSLGVPVSVTVDNKLDPNSYFLSEITLSENTITVTGPSTEIRQIRELRATFTLSDPESITAELSFAPYDKDGNPVDTAYLSYSSDRVTATAQVYSRKTVPLEIDIKNYPKELPEGGIYFEITPSEAVLYGRIEALEAVSRISLGTADAALLSSGELFSYSIALPGGISGIDLPEKAEARVRFSGVEDVTLVSNNINFINVPQGTEATLDTAALVLEVRADAQSLYTGWENAVTVTVDLSGIDAAQPRHTLGVKVTFGGGVKAVVLGEVKAPVRLFPLEP